MGKHPFLIKNKCILICSNSEMLKGECCFHENKRLNIFKGFMKIKKTTLIKGYFLII